MRGSVSYRLARIAGILLFLVLAGCATPTQSPTPTLALTPMPGPAPAATLVPVVVWISQVGSSDWDRGDGVAVDGSGNVVVAGATLGALPGQTNAGSWDIFARKCSPAGVELWVHQSGSSGSDGALATAVDASGNVILVGHTDGTLPGQTNAGYDDAFVWKLSPAGAELWTLQFGSSAPDWAFGVAVDASGNIILAGATDGTLPGQTSAGAWDAFVRKLSPAGAELWTLQFGTSTLDRATGVAVDGSGNILVIGNTDGTLPGQTRAGSWDAFVVHLAQQSASGPAG